MLGIEKKSSNNVQKRLTEKDLILERKQIDNKITFRYANYILVAFFISLFFTFSSILLKGGRGFDISDSVISYLLMYTVSHIPAMLMAIIYSVFKKR